MVNFLLEDPLEIIPRAVVNQPRRRRLRVRAPYRSGIASSSRVHKEGRGTSRRVKSPPIKRPERTLIFVACRGRCGGCGQVLLNGVYEVSFVVRLRAIAPSLEGPESGERVGDDTPPRTALTLGSPTPF